MAAHWRIWLDALRGNGNLRCSIAAVLIQHITLSYQFALDALGATGMERMTVGKSTHNDVSVDRIIRQKLSDQVF